MHYLLPLMNTLCLFITSAGFGLKMTALECVSIWYLEGWKEDGSVGIEEIGSVGAIGTKEGKETSEDETGSMLGIT